jgi:hypothetical protein
MESFISLRCPLLNVIGGGRGVFFLHDLIYDLLFLSFNMSVPGIDQWSS